ncbi:hypothetical protein ONZ45_g12134 [Pleurotus djamor]|nr:hypothetical protein ONZ45_g12134 [Pleurotus djamor]
MQPRTSLAVASALAFANSGVLAAASPPSANQCCVGLRSVLSPSQVLDPNSPLYATQQSTYYSGEQAVQHPTCRVTPRSASDVSAVMKFATQNGCEFAVRSGGHMSWEGSSNIGPEGFTIDLESLTEIQLSDDSTTVSIPPGLRWADVYGFLQPHHLHTAGGRSSGVGVGGFLVGGGISFLSLEHGFGSDTIIDYEVVLSNGSIVHANENERSDLYWALKGGSTNYGIVTKFQMPTFPLDQMWGGSLFFNASIGLQLFEYLVDFTTRLAIDPQGLSAFSFAWNPTLKDYAVWSPNAYLKPVAFPPLFEGLRDFDAFEDTMRITNLVSVTDEINVSSPGGSRTQWIAAVFDANAQFPWDTFLHGKELFADDVQRPGVTWALTVQPINVGMIAAAANRGGNPFGLSVSDGDQFLLLASTFWTNPDDDAILKAKTQQFEKWIRDTAGERGILNRFIYMNYALDTQPVLESFGQENFNRMKEIKNKYDPENLLKLWKGGWKL